MAGGVFEVDVDATEIADVLSQYRKRGGNLGPVMDVVAEQLAAGVSDRYDSTGDGTWDPLAEITKAQRRGGGTSEKPLVNTGVLSGSTEAHSGSDFAEATTGEAYIVYHLDGGPIIPKRNPFELDEQIFDAQVDHILDYITEGP